MTNFGEGQGAGGRCEAAARPLRFEAEFSPGFTPAEAVDLAREVEAADFDRLGISDVVLWHDCFVLIALCSEATQRLEIGPMVTNPYTRHPAVLAANLATLSDSSGGRAFLGIGVGAGLEAVGLSCPRPAQALRETIQICRALWGGETLEHRGEIFQMTDARLKTPPRVVPKVAVGTRSAGVMRLGGEVADRVLIGARFWSAETAAQYRGWLAEGAARSHRPLETLEVCPRLTLCVSADGEFARRSVKRYAAHYIDIVRPPDLGVGADFHQRLQACLAEATGWYFDHDRFDPPEIFDLIDDDMVRRFAVAGTPSECAQQMSALCDLGFRSFSLNLAATARPSASEGLAETILGAGEVIFALRA